MTNTPKDAMKAEDKWTYNMSSGGAGFVLKFKGTHYCGVTRETAAELICDQLNELDKLKHQLLTAEMPERTDELMTYAEWLESPMSNDLSAHAYRDAYADYIREYRKSIARLQSENERLREALTKIANWELPPTGKFWDREKTQPTSYETEYGSNGARDYVKNIAKDALLTHPKRLR
jgi:hypothetical protein